MNNWHNGVTPLNETNLNKLIESTDNFPLYRGAVPVDDLDDLKTTGIYYTSSKTLANTGLDYSEYSYSFIVVMALADGGFVIQLLIKPAKKKIRSREFSGSPGTWKAWTECLQETQPTSATLTLEDYFDTIDNRTVVKTGHVVQVFFRAHTNKAITNMDKIANLPYKPKLPFTVPIYTSGRYSFEDAKFSYMGNDNYGWYMGTNIAADTWLQANFTYITDE